MKKLFLKAVLVSMFAVSGLSFGADKLYVGTNAEFEPFEYLQNGEIVGFDGRDSKIYGERDRMGKYSF